MSPPLSWPSRCRRALAAALVALFVSWHLFFLLVRNPLDLWRKEFEGWAGQQAWWPAVQPAYTWAEESTRAYGNLLGPEQGWSMFTPPLARSAPFLTARIDFTDGSSAEVRSPNEPDDLTAYFRFGGWRQRKLEDYMVWKTTDELRRDEELPLWEAYARWSLRRWQAQNPRDPRTPAQVVLLRRQVPFPGPDDDPAQFAPADLHPGAAFHPDGKLK